MSVEPTSQDLSEIEAESEAEAPVSFLDPLEDLYTDAVLAQRLRPIRKRSTDPSMRDALAATSKRMKELFSLSENWERTRGVAVIDKDTNTLVGNFSEYRHRTVKGCRKLLREHSPISIEGTEFVSGWIGESMALRKGEWGTPHDQQEAVIDVIFPELTGAPQVKIVASIYLGGITRADLAADTQLAAASGAIIITLPGGTNIYEAMGVDSRNSLRKALGLQ